MSIRERHFIISPSGDEELVVAAVVVDDAGERGAEAGEVGTALDGVDVVGDARKPRHTLRTPRRDVLAHQGTPGAREVPRPLLHKPPPVGGGGNSTFARYKNSTFENYTTGVTGQKHLLFYETKCF